MPVPETGPDGAGRHATATTTAELDEIEADLARARARVAASMHALGEEVSRRTDWRSWVRERPGWMIAGAVAVGFLLGQLGGGPGVSKRRRF
jgi:hypothetical protein